MRVCLHKATGLRPLASALLYKSLPVSGTTAAALSFLITESISARKQYSHAIRGKPSVFSEIHGIYILV